MKIYWTAIIMMLLTSLFAQVKVNQHKPYSDNYKGSTITLPAMTPAELRSHNSKIDVYQYAEPRAVDIHPQNAGQWKVKDDLWIWTVDIHSQGAKSINLGFTEYNLPEGAALRIRSRKTGNFIGPFTVSDNEEHGQLWTPIMLGDYMTIELTVPEEEMEAVKLTLSSINHGYIDVTQRSLSGDCNVDTRCGSEDGIGLIDRFRDQIQSVAAVSSGGGRFCTGFLINNIQNDSKPYFITAGHCKFTQSNAASLVAYWNYENSECRLVNSSASGSSGDGPLSQFNTGASLVSSAVDGDLDPESVDYTLMLLDDPVDPDYSPYYVGWDIRPVLPDSSFVVHHPNGDEKRISFDYDSPIYTIFEGDTVFIRINDWDIGTTEGGSSGAPLFNMQGQAIGLVSGGMAACGNDEWDEFGSLRRSFQGEGTPETSLSYWLDPDDTGQQVISGVSGSFVLAFSQFNFEVCGATNNSITLDINVDDNFQGDVTLGTDNLPEGVNAAFDQNPIPSGGGTSVTFTGFNNVNSERYVVSISATDGINNNINEISIILDDKSPNNIQLMSPIDISTPVSPVATFMWTDTDADRYDFQISDNLSFDNPIVIREDITEKQVLTSSLSQNTEYFWRVRGKNLCDSGPWTSAVLFRTAGLVCSDQSVLDLNLEIKEERLDTTISIITIEEDFTVGSVTVPKIKGDHTWSGDLAFTLISPAGTMVSLAGSNCSNNRFQNFDIGFSDDGLARKDIPCPFTDGMLYQPEEALTTFNGENAAGDWQLMIVDQFFMDTGVFDEWSLQVCAAEEKNLFSEINNKTLNLCASDETLISEITVSSAFGGPVSLSAFNTLNGLSIEFSPEEVMPGGSSTVSVSGYEGNVNQNSSISIVATDGSLISSTSLLLSLSDAPSDIDLVRPFNDSDKLVGIIDFEWEEADNATSYVLQISEDPLFTILDFEIPEMSNIVSFDVNQLTFGVQYYWRVNSIGIDCNRLSDVFQFNVDLENATYEIQDAGFEVFPNPVKDDLEISFDQALSENLSIQLFDIGGAIVNQDEIKRGINSHTLSTSDLRSGLYYLRFTRPGETTVVKVVKQ